MALYRSVAIAGFMYPSVRRAPPLIPFTPYIFNDPLNLSSRKLASGYLSGLLNISFLMPKGFVLDTIDENFYPVFVLSNIDIIRASRIIYEE